MKTIFLHGLGQEGNSWEFVAECLKGEYEYECPTLFTLVKGELNYENLYTAFKEYCDSQEDTLCLCGLSLGGVLALRYALECPQKVGSLILIGTQYTSPKKLIQMQSKMFKLMPDRAFKTVSVSKEDFIRLSESMADIDMSGRLGEIKCKTLLICGSRDKANKKASEEMEKLIPGSEYTVIHGIGHEVNVMAPAVLAEIIEPYMSE